MKIFFSILSHSFAARYAVHNIYASPLMHCIREAEEDKEADNFDFSDTSTAIHYWI